MNINRLLLRQANLARFYFLLTVAAGFGGGVLILLLAKQISRVVASVFLGGAQLGDVKPWLLVVLCIILLRPIIGFLSDLWASRFAAQVKNHLRSALSEHLLRLGPAHLATQASGDVATVVVQGIDALDAYFSQYLPQLALAAFVPALILAAVFPIDSLTGIILLLTAPLIPLFMVLIGRGAEAVTRRQFTVLRQISAYLLETMQGLTTLKLLGHSDRRGNVQTLSNHYRDVTLSVLRVTFLSAFALELVATISTAIVAVQIGLRLLDGGIQFEQAFFLLMIAPEFYLPLRQLGARFHAGMSGITAAEKIERILATPLPRLVRKEPEVPPAFFSARGIEVGFADVAYRYPGRASDAVAGVSFHLRQGEITALVGASGSGKTTIARLLLKFIAPDLGGIWANGCSLADIADAEWRQQIAYVSQKPAIVRGTIRENLLLARPGASDQEIRTALEQAQLDQVVSELPDGLKPLIGEGGARLSGGEAQRLALARAFLRDSPLVVLDEPSAHLDIVTEMALEAAIPRLLAGRTALLVAHRLGTIKRADQILVFASGQIAGCGQHEELLRQGGLYAQLVQKYGGEP